MPNDSRISTGRQEEIWAHAKAAAREALETGKTENLTALGWAWYDKFAFEEGAE